MAKSPNNRFLNLEVLYLLLLSGITMGCFDFGETYSKLPPGPWRAVLKLDPERNYQQTAFHETKVSDDISFDEVTEGDLPFNFAVVYDDPENFHLEIRNGEEIILLDQITFLKDRATNKDTIIIEFPPYDSYFKVIFEENILEGYWYVPSRGNYQIHFVARHGQDHRFTTLQKKPTLDLTGKWEVLFGLEDSIQEPAIGYFKQNGNHLTGTFVSESGDYRFLEGTVQANKMYLSCFDGAHMFLFEALITDDGTLSGVFRNGIHYLSSWSGKRNENATLKRTADSITKSKPGKFEFSFPDQNGTLVQITDPAFEGKPKIIQILGTWCPNCLDETKFLLDYFKEQKTEVAIIGLAFERHEDPKKALAAIARYRETLAIPYPILLAGPEDKEQASSRLPLLSEIFAYPTLIFLDKYNDVQYIHTGFSGPATPGYSLFKEQFKSALERIISTSN